jgi:hypothetical protein
MVGIKEAVNIPEFRDMSPHCYKIKITSQTEDVETKLGKQLVLNQALQYVGNKLDKEDIGKLMKLMPYANFDGSFNDMTIDYEAATNDILALDRGEVPPINNYDNHIYMIKRLTARMRQADFQFLDPEIQFNYSQRLKAHETIEAEQARAIQLAQAGFVPTGGYLVACDFYIQTDPENPEKSRRARIPSDALEWLMEKLEAQGMSLEKLENVNKENLAEIARMQASGGGGEEMLLPAVEGAEMPA